jgi:PhnB protein
MSTANRYQPVIPYLTATNAAKAIEFYKAAFGATERYRLTSPNGTVGHAELEIMGQVVMVADEFPGMNTSPKTLGGSATTFVLMVPNADAAHDKAVAAGAESVHAPNDAFYGYRMALVKDPAGHNWMVQHEIEKVAPEEMQKRWDSMTGECPASKAAS